MSTPTKRERREAARQARLEREAADAASARRKRRLIQLGAAVAAAAVLVVAAILISGGKDDKSSGGGGSSAAGGLSGSAETQAMLASLPQKGNTLGQANAPVTIYEFADLQCPFCKQFATENLPQLVRDYVANGKAKLVYQDMAFIGPDSEVAAAAADA